MIMLGFEHVNLVSLKSLICCNYVNCCHAIMLYCFPCILGVVWALETWFWGFWSKDLKSPGLNWWMFA